MAEIKSFSECSDEELTQYLKMHYAGKINIGDYWNVGDTRVMHLSAMPATPPYASESHVEQDMTMVIIGIEHDDLVTPINGNSKAALTLQCKETLGNNGNAEYAFIWGSDTSTASDSNYSKNPRRTWLNGTFVNSLPSAIQPLVKTVIKKNIANHSSSPGAGPDTEDKAFLTSYPEMFGSASYREYKGSVALEGEQYPYYNSNAKRTKYWNNNGTASNTAYYYWLRSPSSVDSSSWIYVIDDGSASYDYSDYSYGLAPAFCLAAEPDPELPHKLLKNGKVVQGIAKNGKKLLGIAHAGEVVWKYEEPKPKYRIMTIKIDQSNTNPSTCCTYADDAVNMTPGSKEWDDFFGHYPVMLLNGVEGKKLNRNDFTKHEDGSSADITTGAEGDVMIAFPRRGVKISTDENNVVTVSMTDNPNDPTFEYNAHRRNDEQKDVFYLGAYKGYEMSSKLRSLSGKKPTVSKSLTAFRTSAQANGKSNGTSSGYEQSGWFQLIFRQVMYLLKFRNLNSQSAVGYGYEKSNRDSVNTGGTDTYGMDSELIKASNPSYMTDGKHQVKCLGMEDFWGNIYEWIDGMGTDSSGNIMTATTNFNSSRSNYKNSGQGGKSLSGYIKTVQGSTEAGFAIKTSGGSETTCFSDYSYLYSSYFPYFGGYWGSGGSAGAFCLRVDASASYSNSTIGARLMYL